MTLPSISSLDESQLKGRRVLVRVGYDVPLQNGKVANDFRIRESLKTIEYLTSRGARVILLSHIGRDKEDSLLPVGAVLQAYIPRAVFVNGIVGSEVDALVHDDTHPVVLLGNLRSHEGEVSNSTEFAKTLAGYGGMFVNEAFSVSHRAHASLVGIPEFLPSYAGIGFAREVLELSHALSPRSPSIFVLGGAKFETKLPLVKKFLPLYDRIFVCGALAHDVFRARGIPIGMSLVGDEPLIDPELLHNEKIILPRDVRVRGVDGSTRMIPPRAVAPSDVIIDAGPETVDEIVHSLKSDGTLLWNGPLGNYEAGYGEATRALAEGVAFSGVHAIVGGGDTVAAIEELGLNDKFTHVSTGGGAMLEFLEHGTLPAIEAMVRKVQ